MPGTGKYSGPKYRGHLRPSNRLTAKEVETWSDSRLQEIEDTLNDAYDFDAVDATAFHNMEIVQTEWRRRRAARSPLGLGIIQITPNLIAEPMFPDYRTTCAHCGKKLTFGFKHGKKQPGGICTKGTCPMFAKPQYE